MPEYNQARRDKLFLSHSLSRYSFLFYIFLLYLTRAIVHKHCYESFDATPTLARLYPELRDKETQTSGLFLQKSVRLSTRLLCHVWPACWGVCGQPRKFLAISCDFFGELQNPWLHALRKFDSINFTLEICNWNLRKCGFWNSEPFITRNRSPSGNKDVTYKFLVHAKNCYTLKWFVRAEKWRKRNSVVKGVFARPREILPPFAQLSNRIFFILIFRNFLTIIRVCSPTITIRIQLKVIPFVGIVLDSISLSSSLALQKSRGNKYAEWT